MEDIPVTFKYKGKLYSGQLCPMFGAGSEHGSRFYLHIKSYYCGTLHKVLDSQTPWLPTEKNVKTKWIFSSQTGEFEELVDFFEDVLIAWYQ